MAAGCPERRRRSEDDAKRWCAPLVERGAARHFGAPSMLNSYSMDETDDPPRGLKKGTGITPAERYLKTLCDSTFLSLWSFPAIYREQGQSSGLEKELCDLFVVFGNHILIFSDKACAFPKHLDISIAWRRWFRRAIVISARQGLGAERWIRAHPDRLFLDAACTRRIPFPLPKPEDASFILSSLHIMCRKCAQRNSGAAEA